MEKSRAVVLASVIAFTAGSFLTLALAQQPPAASSKTYEQRLEETLARFRESPAEEAAKQVVLTRYKLRLQGKYMESMQYLHPDFTEHMTPARMPKAGKSAYQTQLEQAQRMAASPARQVDEKSANYPVQARASEDLVTLFHAYGCDIFRVKDDKVSDHWDCTPWEPFNNPGERKQIEDQVREQMAREAANK